MYKFELERILREIKQRSAKKVVLQAPDILKSKLKNIADQIETKTKALVILSGESCYGACDLANQEAKILNADLLIHFGHSRFFKEAIPTLYIPLKDDIDILKPLKKNLERVEKFKKIGLAATVQHVHKLTEIKKFLEKIGKQALIGYSKLGYHGQILGCDVSACRIIEPEVDCFLCISSGNFHGLGIAMATEKPVFVLDPYRKEIRSMNDLKKSYLRKMYARIEKAIDAEAFGIIIGLKRGQMNLEKALEIKKKLEEWGKKAYLITMREINPDKLINFPEIEVFVITACPRIAYDTKGWKQIVINVEDLYQMLG